MQQEWMLVPILIDGVPARDSVPEYVPAQNIWQCNRKKQMQYTNIERLLSIAAGHPLVSEVEGVDKSGAVSQQDKEMGEQPRVTRADLT